MTAECRKGPPFGGLSNVVEWLWRSYTLMLLRLLTTGNGTERESVGAAGAGPQPRGKQSLGCCFVCAGETGKE
jgi:hypothetical protein